jgi:hypothetical protein
VTLFAGGRQFTFVPVTFGRFRGHVHKGQASPTATYLAERLEALGLDPTKARLLAATSSLEGGFDTFHTYGHARVAWGMVQFTATGGLPALLTRLKAEAPATFDRYFRAAGLEVEPGLLVVRTGASVRRGWQALNHLHGEPALWLAFVRAAQDPAVQDMQIRAAYEHYLLRSGQLLVEKAGQRYTLGGLLAGEPLGEALLFDLAVAHGLTHTQRLFQRAVRQVNLESSGAAEELMAVGLRLDSAYAPRWEALKRALAAGSSGNGSAVNGEVN